MVKFILFLFQVFDTKRGQGPPAVLQPKGQFGLDTQVQHSENAKAFQAHKENRESIQPAIRSRDLFEGDV